jgi:glycosyltransferase involved in cell wall biosynthesis
VPWPRVETWTGPVDVVDALNYVAPPSRAPVTVMVHDLTFVRFPELCTADTLRYDGLLRSALARGAVVHTPSNAIAAEVREHYRLAEDRVVAIHSGIPEVTGGDAARGAQLAGASRYVLALGTIEPRKNLPVLVDAFDRVADDDAEVVLVVAGPDGWDRDRFEAALGCARHADRVRRTGWVGGRDRADLLAGATVFAYPSIYEGFGFPPLEAMSAGVPVLAATAGALPEVLGDAAAFVDPSDVDGIASALARLLADDDERARLVGLGHEQVGRYSWDRTADELVALYRRLR